MDIIIIITITIIIELITIIIKLIIIIIIIPNMLFDLHIMHSPHFVQWTWQVYVPLWSYVVGAKPYFTSLVNKISGNTTITGTAHVSLSQKQTELTQGFKEFKSVLHPSTQPPCHDVLYNVHSTSENSNVFVDYKPIRKKTNGTCK